MKVSNAEIYVAVDAIRRLMEVKLPIKTSFKLAKLADKLDEKFRVIERVRLDLVKQHGKEDGTGNYSVKPEHESWTGFLEDYNELMNQEVDFKFETVSLPPIEIEPSIMLGLVKFVELEDEQE